MGRPYYEGTCYPISSKIYEQEDSHYFSKATVFEEQSQEKEGQTAQGSSLEDS